MKYHVNEMGVAGPCRAKKACPFGDLEADHYSTVAAAQEAFELSMKATNATTLKSYDRKIADYIAGSPQVLQGPLKEWVDETLKQIPEGGRILELGSGFGRDALYFKERNFDVIATDGSAAFVAELQAKGLNTRALNVLEDSLPYSDAVYANAVFLHFTKNEAKESFPKVLDALPDGGLFAFTLKEGKGEGWSQEKISAPRYFSYWQEKEITTALEGAGFEDVVITRDKQGSTTWLQITAKKPHLDEKSYKMQHQPRSDGAQAYDVETHFPDFYAHPEYYRTGDKTSDKESIAAIKAMRQNPEAEVVIYRAVPQTAYGIEAGNWVTLSKSYAKGHGAMENPKDDWPVVAMKVKAKDLRNDGDSINEWGYFPQT